MFPEYELRIPGDSPCSCSHDCDRYILGLEAEIARLRAGLERMRDWPKVGEHRQVLSISHGLLADYIEDILEPTK